MGGLSLPSNGPVYLDANVFIYSVEKIAPYCHLLDPMWHAAQVGRFELVSSELVLLETLVKPLRMGDTVLQRLFRSVLHSREVRLIPVTAALWEASAGLRAATGMKTPDALHAATALASGCSLFATNDAGFRRAPGLPVVVLDDLLRP